MTVATTVAKSRYAGDGSTTAFPTGFKFVQNSHVRVVLRSAAGAETVWTEGSEYSLSGAGNPSGGTVTVSTSPTDFTPAVGETLVVKLSIPQIQDSALPLGGAFPSTTVEGMSDLAALRDQELGEELSRTLKFKETTALEDLEMPEPEASKVLAWNSGATALENIDKPADGAAGADGADGNTILNGTAAPTGGTGVDGDFFIDTVADDIYGPKTGGAWGGATSLIGPQGAAGNDGVFSEIASQAEAEAGVENTKGMTPLRTAQAITAQGTGIADNAVTNAKLADVATSTIKGRVTAATGDPEDLTPAQVRTMINVADGANNYSHPNHTGDVTSSGDGATTIANDAVTNAKAADMAQATLKGRASGAGTGDPTDLSAAQVRTILNVADGSTANPNALDNVAEDTTPQLGGELDGQGNAAVDVPYDVVTAETASFTFAAGQAGRLTPCNSAGAMNATVPPNSTVAFAIGTTLAIWNQGAGAVTWVAGGGVTLQRDAALTLVSNGQHAVSFAVKVATDTWVVAGGLAAA